jgi:glyoxylase-like metal-dependent hydrolase (beta-lactamase superfamily II)
MKVSGHVYAVTGLGYIPPWSVNAGFVVGKSRTLAVDTGPSFFAAQTVIGYAQSVRPENAILAVNTERHTDHMLGNGAFRDRGYDVIGHASILRKPEDLAAEIEEMNRCIPQPFRRKLGEGAAFFKGTRVENPNVRVSRDEVLDLGNLEVRILLTPGHTSSNLSVYVPKDGVLFCGDCVTADYVPYMEDPTADTGSWLASLDRIEEIRPAVLVPGHGNVLKDEAVLAEIGRIRRILKQFRETGKQA